MDLTLDLPYADGGCEEGISGCGGGGGGAAPKGAAAATAAAATAAENGAAAAAAATLTTQFARAILTTQYWQSEKCPLLHLPSWQF